MRPGVHLVNVGRGALLNESAFKTALDSGIVGRASLDVFDPEPPPAGHWAYGHPRLRLTPHISSSTDLTEQSADALLRENAVRFAQGQVQALHAPVSLQDGY
jgi:phosphoglycerate dehydrogenase-like enzyme